MIFTLAIILGLLSCIVAAALAFKLRRAHPELHIGVDKPAGTEWWPFWVFHFLSQAKLSGISPGLKVLAITSITSLALSIALLAYIVIRFAFHGGSL